ncbi:MAG: beta strand repeat-containing protein [Prosthecobacter sp.]
MGFSWNSSRSVARERQHARMNALPLLAMTLVFLVGLGPQAAAQSPDALPYPATGRYVGTVQDSEEGQVSTDQSMSFTSATAFVVPPNTTGTYTYAKTGANTATMTYQAHTVVGDYQQHENTTAQLVFTSPTTGSYTSSGSYTGSYFGLPFSGTLSNGVGTFSFKVLPTVTTPTHTAVQTTSATLGGTVASDGAGTITTRGVVYCLQSVSTTPEVNGSGVTLVTSPGTTGAFTVNATGLTPGVAYAYRAVAVNEIGRGYSPTGTFTTAPTAPTISTPTYASVTHSSAVLGGNVTSDRGSPITERGVVFAPSATNGDPLIGGTGVTKAATTGTTGVFTTPVAVAPATQYSFKAYATNALGTTYTSPATVFASFSGPPVLSAPTTSSLTQTTVTLGGTVTSDGGASVTERGVVMAETAVNATPAIGGNGVTKGTSAGTTGTFSVAFTGLTPGTSYSFRAYGTNTHGTAYTSPVSTFTTATGPPLLSAPASTAVTASTATLGGTVTHHGGASVSECGVVYAATSVNADPQIDGSGVTRLTTSGAVGAFTVNAPALQPGTSYTFRAYAISSLGTGYTTPAATFTTLSVLPTVATPTSASVAANTATLGGNVTSDGAGGITERGVVYALTATNGNPTIGGTGVVKATAAGTTGVFTTGVTGLTAFSGYSFCAYATNAAGTGYSPVSAFTTLTSAPTLSSLPTSAAIMATTADLGGVVLRDNGSSITERGVVYARTSVNSNPGIGGSGVVQLTTTPGTGAFSLTATGLTTSTGYSFKAYAINSLGTTYSSTGTFTTFSSSAPTVTTPTKTNVTNTTATLGGNVTSDGHNLITERGIVYSWSTANSNPTIGNQFTTKVATTGTTGVFTVNVTGIGLGGETYSFKAYAINAAGTSYSPVSTFTTNATGPGTVALASPTQDKLDITLRGNIISQGGLTITERGVVYAKTSVNALPAIGGTGVMKAVSASSAQSGVFSVAVLNLDPFSHYSYRPYVTNSAGTSYSGAADSFSTTVGNPTVAVPTSTGITGTTATLGASVVTTGGQPITFYGVCYALTSVNSSPRPNGTGVTKVDGTAPFTGPGAFTVAVTGLAPASSHTFSVYAGHDDGFMELYPAGTFTTLPLTHQENWRQTHFGTTANTGSAADAFDHDKDGLANLIEYAFGLTPTAADSWLMPQPQHDGSTFSVSFTQPASVSGVTYGAQWSTTLLPGSWTDIPDTGSGTFHVFSVPVSTGTQVFVRLVVTAP